MPILDSLQNTKHCWPIEIATSILKDSNIFQPPKPNFGHQLPSFRSATTKARNSRGSATPELLVRSSPCSARIPALLGEKTGQGVHQRDLTHDLLMNL
jgi:hypothetical protein